MPGQGQGWDMFHLLDGDGLSLGVNFADLYPDPKTLNSLHEFPKGTSQKSWCMPELKNHWFRLEKNGREKTKSVNSGWAPG